MTSHDVAVACFSGHSKRMDNTACVIDGFGIRIWSSVCTWHPLVPVHALASRSMKALRISELVRSWFGGTSFRT